MNYHTGTGWDSDLEQERKKKVKARSDRPGITGCLQSLSAACLLHDGGEPLILKLHEDLPLVWVIISSSQFSKVAFLFILYSPSNKFWSHTLEILFYEPNILSDYWVSVRPLLRIDIKWLQTHTVRLPSLKLEVLWGQKFANWRILGMYPFLKQPYDRMFCNCCHKYHKLVGFNNRNTFLTVLEARSPKLRAGSYKFPGGALYTCW